ncbi:duplicated orphan permease [Mucilaginibacter gossypiicola]|uniref:Duplicated orphan permease n=1 Tax=Mucilaginibacter gossypiicola TaxID=551995 RepID=A0A1H7ZHY6_9SPHI|nr:ABC transporter permease [Mucilaginibacter gossypiicola]SEM57158.1 duplicated orphan permease [Mucilaginibacter gossypiicola]
MIGNYIKTTVRGLAKNRAYSFLNIAGLAIGVACASMIFLWVQDELTFNHSFVKRDNLYTVRENQTYDGKTSTFRATPGPMAAALKGDIPGVKNAARMGGENEMVFALGEKVINEQGSYADAEIFPMLKLSFVQGDEANVFHDLHSVVINTTMAKKFFGDANPIGKTLKMNNEHDFTVTGVFSDLPKNSTFQMQWFAPLKNIEHMQPWQQDWGANWTRTYVELEPSADVNAINKKLAHYLGTKKNGNGTICFLFGMNDWNLRDKFTDGKMSGGRIEYVRLFSAIAFIILIIACINFMNLSTARSEKRAKEVGVHKVMGAGKGKLITQFIGEAVIMAFIAVIIAVVLVYAALPSFNNMVQKELTIDLLQPFHLFYLLSIGLVTGLLAGSYPAFYLSSFNPITVLKNIKLPSAAGAGFIRQSLVVIQFSVSIILIIGTVIIYQQIQHVKNRELGYQKDNLVYIDTKGKITDHFTAVNNELKQTGVVADASLSEYPVLQIWSNTDNFSWDGKDASKNPLITIESVSPQFVSTMNMKLVAGRDFYANAKLDSSNVIINEAFAKQMGKAGHVGGIVRDGGNKPYQIAGIIKDFLYNDMYVSGAPLMLFSRPQNNNILTIRFKQGVNLTDALAKTGEVYKRANPGYPFEYKFVDADFDELFKTEALTGKLSGVFASLAVVISCLGLFGLAAYTAERRIKEIGIRKVLGASVVGLTGLLSRDFLKLVVVSCLIAFPVAWYAINNWLQSYQYRVTVQWWVFAAAGIAAIFIALATVSFQAIKAALSNPVKSLRSE